VLERCPVRILAFLTEGFVAFFSQYTCRKILGYGLNYSEKAFSRFKEVLIPAFGRRTEEYSEICLSVYPMLWHRFEVFPSRVQTKGITASVNLK
jgi:hypothetical protein